eukprot:scaffold3715_cov37-Tisochrysis_lutea.AAC.6
MAPLARRFAPTHRACKTRPEQEQAATGRHRVCTQQHLPQRLKGRRGVAPLAKAAPPILILATETETAHMLYRELHAATGPRRKARGE